MRFDPDVRHRRYDHAASRRRTLRRQVGEGAGDFVCDKDGNRTMFRDPSRTTSWTYHALSRIVKQEPLADGHRRS